MGAQQVKASYASDRRIRLIPGLLGEASYNQPLYLPLVIAIFGHPVARPHSISGKRVEKGDVGSWMNAVHLYPCGCTLSRYGTQASV